MFFHLFSPEPSEFYKYPFFKKILYSQTVSLCCSLSFQRKYSLVCSMQRNIPEILKHSYLFTFMPFFFHHTLKGSISCLKLFTAHLCFNPYTLLFKKLLIIFLLFILLVAFSVVYPLRRLYHCWWYPSWQFSLLLASGTTVFS